MMPFLMRFLPKKKKKLNECRMLRKLNEEMQIYVLGSCAPNMTVAPSPHTHSPSYCSIGLFSSQVHSFSDHTSHASLTNEETMGEL
jgi:hypothetical protein